MFFADNDNIIEYRGFLIKIEKIQDINEYTDTMGDCDLKIMVSYEKDGLFKENQKIADNLWSKLEAGWIEKNAKEIANYLAMTNIPDNPNEQFIFDVEDEWTNHLNNAKDNEIDMLAFALQLNNISSSIEESMDDGRRTVKVLVVDLNFDEKTSNKKIAQRNKELNVFANETATAYAGHVWGCTTLDESFDWHVSEDMPGDNSELIKSAKKHIDEAYKQKGSIVIECEISNEKHKFKTNYAQEAESIKSHYEETMEFYNEEQNNVKITDKQKKNENDDVRSH